MALIRPLSEMRDQMDRIFHEMEEFQLPSVPSWRMHPFRERMLGSWLPPADVLEENGNYLVQVEVPGVKAENLNVEILDDAIIVRGETRQEKTEEKRNVYLRECHVGSVYRRIPLPGTIKTEGATAELKHGLLSLKLPKAEEKKGRQIPVQTK
jgi:HSP20 family protein